MKPSVLIGGDSLQPQTLAASLGHRERISAELHIHDGVRSHEPRDRVEVCARRQVGADHQEVKRAQELLTDLGLGARLNHLPGQLSGGEQQRVAIARALIADPDLVLADEPTGNLDSRTARQVMDLLLSLQETHGFALVVATHDEAVARQLDRRWSLLDGALMTC
ncbi:MAG: ATP-binding cassette domain-containing protein [Chloroflexi bacterium]|nr:ATP-binding cassette domain-containing protein [Chloroflexota bacterium]